MSEGAVEQESGHLDPSRFDYADQVTMRVLLQETLWETTVSPPSVAWHLELPSNYSGNNGRPVDLRVLAAEIAALPYKLEHRGGCCGNRPYVLQTRHSQVEIGPSGASAEFLLYLTEHVADSGLDYFLGAAGVALVRRLAHLLKGDSEDFERDPLSATEADERSRAALQTEYGVLDLVVVGEAQDRETGRRTTMYRGADTRTYGATVGLLADNLVSVVKVWRVQQAP